MGHVPHLHIPRPWDGGRLPLSDDQQHHLRRVLRVGPGDPVSYTDGAGAVGSGELSEADVERGEEESVPPPLDLTVAVAPPASRHRARFLVEKLAEIGVRRLVWVRTRRSEGRPPSADKARAWAVAALEQSRGGWLMEVVSGSIADFEPETMVVADPDGPPEPGGEATVLLVGPEGGLDTDEVPDGVRRISLGPTILRVETAAIAGAILLRSRR